MIRCANVSSCVSPAAAGAPTTGANGLRRPGEESDDYMKRVERELRETE